MTPLFAFDAFAFSYYLGTKIGEIKPGRPAYMPGYTLTFKKNKVHDFAKAVLQEKPKERVYSVLYELDGVKFDHLKKILPGFGLELRWVTLNKNRSAWAMVLKNDSDDQFEQPKAWYIDLMKAGLNEVRTPVKYVQKIAKLPVNTDYHLFASTAKNILKYPEVTKKYIAAALAAIDKLNAGGRFIIKSKRHPFNGRTLSIAKETEGFSFETTTLIKKGRQSPKEFIVGNPALKLSGQYLIEQKGYYVNNISYGDSEKHIKGGIQGIATLGLPAKCYWRLLIPIPEAFNVRRDYFYWSYLSNGKLYQELLKMQLIAGECHLYGIKQTDQHYLVIELLNEESLVKFQETIYPVLLVFAILQGKFYSGEGYFIAYATTELKTPIGLAYHSMSNGRYALPAMFTTNVYQGIEQVKVRHNNKGTYSQAALKKRKVGLGRFPEAQIDGLINLLLEKDKIREALTQIVLNQNATLEIKIPVLFVALETITSALVTGGNKDLKPITDNKTADDLVVLLQATAKDFAVARHFSEKEMEKFQVFVNKLGTLNQPPNVDKLSKLFPNLGYPLKEVDKAALNNRNAFLHGYFKAKGISAEDRGFKELYDLSLRLQFLLVTLLLKKVGFSGKIINYNKLHEHITQIFRDEDVFIMI